MSLLMYDSIDPSGIPPDAAAVAGYIDNPPRSPGLPAWPAGAFDRFSTPLKVRIARIATTDDGHALDVETGAATPTESRGWVQLRLNAGIVPAVYVNRSNRAAVEAACAGLPFRLWVATLDGTQAVTGALAVQYVDVGPYDLSACDPEFFGGWFMGILGPDDLTAIKGLLDAGTGAGQPDWAHTSQAILATVQQNQNLIGTANAKLDALKIQIGNLQVPPANLQPVLDAIAALKADLDSLTLKKV